MPRLNNQAFEILRAEVKRLTDGNLAHQVQRDIVLRRLEKLRLQSGELATYEELRDTLNDIFPDFDQRILKAAARANRPSKLVSTWGTIKFVAIALAGITGGIYVLNLPYPMIRRPVAQTLPIVLLPSYLSMDYHYRQTISLVEQADQLVNQASSSADFALGQAKVKQAQTHLDALPVWFLGYEPHGYCAFFSCSFRFTLDEFRQARASVGRMEAKLFQEQNAQTALTQGEAALTAAKQRYQQATAQIEKEEAIAAWQTALDTLQEIPPQTLAGRNAQTRLVANQRDFEQVAGRTAGLARSNTLITAAKTFAIRAAQASQNPPHPEAEWEQMIELWEMAIDRLNQVPLEDPGYSEAQELLAEYQSNLGTIEIRLAAEKEAVSALESAKAEIPGLLALSESASPQMTASQLQRIINRLSTIKAGTTAYSEAQSLLQSAQAKLRQLQE